MRYIMDVQKDDFSKSVTVVVHTYNHEDFIGKCIESILDQDYLDNIKILVIDDCSTDNTLRICNGFKEKFPEHLTIAALPYNQLSAGLFVGLDHLRSIKSKYVAWCDGDDYWEDTEKITKQVAILDKNSEIGIVHTDYKLMKITSERTEIRERTDPEIQASEKFTTGFDLVKGNRIKHSTAMILRESIDFDFVGLARGIYAGDWLICVSASRKHKIHFMKDKTTVARITDKGVWNGSSDARNNDQKTRIRWHCATYLEESDLRERFRRKVIIDWIRDKISRSILYRPVRPVMQLVRRNR